MSTQELATAPLEVMHEIAAGSLSLDELGKAMDTAVNEYNAADEEWLVLYDQVAEDLQEEAGDKRGPAEHLILSTARRQNRAAYTRWKRAKRHLDSLRDQIKARSAAMNGRQSQLSALRDEMRQGSYEPRGAPVVFGGRRAE